MELGSSAKSGQRHPPSGQHVLRAQSSPGEEEKVADTGARGEHTRYKNIRERGQPVGSLNEKKRAHVSNLATLKWRRRQPATSAIKHWRAQRSELTMVTALSVRIGSHVALLVSKFGRTFETRSLTVVRAGPVTRPGRTQGSFIVVIESPSSVAALETAFLLLHSIENSIFSPKDSPP